MQRPPWATAFPEIIDIYDDHPCVPIGNVIEDNTFCHATSRKAGATFVDQTEATIRSWLSAISNNVEDCAPRGQQGRGRDRMDAVADVVEEPAARI